MIVWTLDPEDHQKSWVSLLGLFMFALNPTGAEPKANLDQTTISDGIRCRPGRVDANIEAALQSFCEVPHMPRKRRY